MVKKTDRIAGRVYIWYGHILLCLVPKYDEFSQGLFWNLTENNERLTEWDKVKAAGRITLDPDQRKDLFWTIFKARWLKVKW